MKNYRIVITQRLLLTFEAEVQANSEEEAMELFEKNNNENEYEEEWLDAHDYSEILDECMNIYEVEA